ncbi:MAG: glycoside hydrolase family 172 protein, partial [Planctomycetota bacterium JB042]
MPSPLPLLAALLAPAPAPIAPSAVDARLWEVAFPVPASFRETRLWSSFDRTGGNDDGFTGRFEPEPGGGRTLVDARGPGALVRVWSANPTDAPIELWHDDEPAPRRVVPFREWFERGTSGGHVAYPYLPFERRLRVVARGPVRFHQWNTLRFDPAPPTPPDPPDAEAVDDLRPVRTWIGADGTPIRTFAPISFPLALGPGQGLRAELRGAGAVTRWIVDARSEDPSALRRTLLRIRVDGEESPRVEAPLADFFAIGGPGASIDSVPFTAADGRLVCRFVVPFGDGLRLDLVSRGRSTLHADVRMEGVRTARDVFGGSRFHARFRHTLTETGAYVDLLRAEGSGRVVGATMTARGPRGLAYLEGDEQALVDGRGPERYHGTGTEDFFNDAWYFASGIVRRPFHGVTWKEGGGVSAYRFLIPDPIPFHRSITFRIEHGGGNDEPGVEVGAVTYWYAGREATHDFEPIEAWMLAPPRR